VEEEGMNQKTYEAEGFTFEFIPHGDPHKGVLSATGEGHGTYTAEISLTKLASRNAYADDAGELYKMDSSKLKRALNEICTLRLEEVAAAVQADEEAEQSAPEPLSEEAEMLVANPGVLDRYAEGVASIQDVVKDRNALRLQTLVAVGAQLAPLVSGKPAGANLILIAESGRGKNYICDAVAVALPDEFHLSFESSSAKSFYYQAEEDPEVLKHTWLYPNEAEATDLLVEMLRPLLSGGRASHMTVNKTGEGRNAAQELRIEGPASITIPTVRNKLDAQLQTRTLVAELLDYEGRVADHSRAVSRQLLPGNAGMDHTPQILAWQAALRSLTAHRRVVFDLDHEQFCFDSDEVSYGARLWANVLGLMLAHAWLEQRNREIIELTSGEQAIVATPEDYEAAYRIFAATCERSIVNLSVTHRKILDAAYELKQDDSSAGGFTQRKLAEKAGVHHSTVGDNKTFLTKSAKLLRETDDGLLTLVAGSSCSFASFAAMRSLISAASSARCWR
jgi:major membrane immunogen (membrane-anchored lipoprotein)